MAAVFSAAVCALFVAGLVAPGTIMLDVRGPGAYVQRHLRGASSIPLAELEARLFELPAPTEDALALVGADATELRAAAEILGERGWAVAGAVDASDPAAWAACLAAGWAEAPAGSACSAPSWRANLFLRGALGGLLGEAARAEAAAAGAGAPEGAARPGARVALDLGAGNGRDAIFLAEQLGGAWDVVAVDNNGGALARCEALAARAGVGTRVRTDARNLRRGGARCADGWTDGSVRIAHGSRFLVKALLPVLRDAVLVEAGALFIWSTFLEPKEGADENRAPPFRPSRRLQRGELAHAFRAELGWRVLRDEEGELVTRGEAVPANFFAAVRERRADRGPGAEEG